MEIIFRLHSIQEGEMNSVGIYQSIVYNPLPIAK